MRFVIDSNLLNIMISRNKMKKTAGIKLNARDVNEIKNALIADGVPANLKKKH